VKVYADQFAKHLQGPLQNAYWLSGDEPLQMRDCADQLRRAARVHGYTERDVHEVERQFDWRTLAASGSNMSLFSDKKLIELRLRSSKLEDNARKILTEFLQEPAPDTLLLINSPKIESATSKTQWFRKIADLCVLVQIYPVELPKLPSWILRQMQQRKLTADADAVQLLAERVEGNMLAAEQEIEKLGLLFGPGAHLDIRKVAQSVADSSRFNIFALVDACLAGKAGKAVKTLRSMREEGAEALMINAMLARELRQLRDMAEQIENGIAFNAVLQSGQVWKNRQPLVSGALQRGTAGTYRRLADATREIDISVKGMGITPVWVLLEQLVLEMSGKTLRLQYDPASQ